MQYEKLMARCNIVQYDLLSNAYYDSDGVLSENNATFRVRSSVDMFGFKNAPILMQLKITKNSKDGIGFRDSVEIKEVFDSKYISKSNQHILEIEKLPLLMRVELKQFNITALGWIGVMECSRATAVLPSSISITIDHCCLSDNTQFYEVEIENEALDVHSKALKEIKKLIGEYKIPKLSKFQRFVQSLGFRLP
jgi:uncharacterized protein YjbK